MFRGKMALPPADRLHEDLTFLTTRFGVDAIQFYDHNFFDREVDMMPLFEVLAKFQLPWWCFARSDALLNLSEHSWDLLRKSRLRMAYIGAESPSDWLLHDIRKGTRPDQTLAAIEACRRHSGTVFHVGAPPGSRGRDREDSRFYSPDQAPLPGNRDHDLHLHAVAAASGQHECRRCTRGERAA